MNIDGLARYFFEDMLKIAVAFTRILEATPRIELDLEQLWIIRPLLGAPIWNPVVCESAMRAVMRTIRGSSR